MNQLVSSVAGLGLFLSGLHLLSEAMQSLAGRRMRRVLARFTVGPWRSAVAGTFLGGLTQSTSAAAFVCIGLLNTGTLSMSGALSLSAWASVGTSLLVFLAAIDVRVLGLYAIGLVGLAHLFNAKSHRTGAQLVSVAFALGLLLVGLGLVKEASIGLAASPWAIEFFQFTSENGLVGFLVGVIVTLLVQSSATIGILAVTLNLGGMLPFADATLLVCGASVGSGLSVALVTAHLQSQPRQLAIWQCIVKIIGTLVVLPILALQKGGIDGLRVVVSEQISVPTLIALVYLSLQVAGAIVSGLFQRKLRALLERWIPMDPARTRFAAQYIYPDAAENPETALLLAGKEQNRLVSELPPTLDPLRPDEVPQGSILANSTRHRAAGQLCTEIDEFIAEVTVHGGSAEIIARVFELHGRNESIRALQNSLHTFVEILEPYAGEGLVISMVEGLHLTLTLADELLVTGEDHAEILRQLVSDRSQLMENIRQALLEETTDDLGRRQTLFVATGIFERILWLVRQLLGVTLAETITPDGPRKFESLPDTALLSTVQALPRDGHILNSRA